MDAGVNLQALLILPILALAVSAITITLSKTTIFQGFRDFVWDRNRFLGKLLECPYCLSHWVGFGFILIYHPSTFSSSGWRFFIEQIVNLFVIVALTAMSNFLIYQSILSFKVVKPPETK